MRDDAVSNDLLVYKLAHILVDLQGCHLCCSVFSQVLVRFLGQIIHHVLSKQVPVPTVTVTSRVLIFRNSGISFSVIVNYMVVKAGDLVPGLLQAMKQVRLCRP